ncbi:MAG: hypothetical protein WCQ99_06210 [Pseudomonadota bacterium]
MKAIAKKYTEPIAAIFESILLASPLAALHTINVMMQPFLHNYLVYVR